MLELVRRQFNLADISEPMDAVTTIDEKQEVVPECVDVTREGKARIWKAVEQLYHTGTQPAITLCIRRRGKILLNRGIGFAKGNGPGDLKHDHTLPATTETPVCLFSSSKAMTAILMHKLAEQGAINLMDPVSFYLPEFSKHGKQNITIHQILSHRGGIPGLPTRVPVETLYDNDEVWRLLCDAKPIAVDGAKLAYHAITGGFVLARVLEQVTGKSIQQYLDTHIRKPMRMKYFTYGIGKQQRQLVAKNYATGPNAPFPVSWAIKRALGASFPEAAAISNQAPWMDAVIPAANMYATAEEVSRFYQMLLDHGCWNGKQILKPVTVQRAIQEFGGCTFDRTMMIPMRYSAGLMLGGDPVGLYGPNTGKAFGHIGLINKFCWADPARQISVALLTTGLSLVSHHLPVLAMLLRQISHYCEPTVMK
ncbi:serine hydrolase domain-containing protein [Hahella ganghwensis]|uniref:serine hydrolase domain-containing protein n=1 Tax=Hahella ganghwensis TaxID=286420 RepID=UPI0003675756|nr:serine hydrolase domain-containing protein [Hahella ganghwensis]